MKAESLRIGNWVYEGKRLDHIHDGFGIDHAHNFKPIPLTEEWLLKLGFVNLRHQGDELFELLYNNTIGYRFSMEGQYGYSEIKHVHQLQNLYFALTGNEIEIQ